MKEPTDPSSSTSPLNQSGNCLSFRPFSTSATDGLLGFIRGIGPALVLVINPVIQYTVFEQLKNALVKRRTTALRAAGGSRCYGCRFDRSGLFLAWGTLEIGERTFPCQLKGLLLKPHSCNWVNIPVYVSHVE